MEIQTVSEIRRNMTHSKPSTSRDAWRKNRSILEKNRSKSNITHFRKHRRWSFFTGFLALTGFFLKLLGLYARGNRTALALKCNTFSVDTPALPKDFQGFEIIHITDIHFDRLIGIEKRIVELLKDRNPDLIVMTGDYRDSMKLPASYYEPIFKLLGENLRAKHGIYAVLGNHDSHDLVPLMENNGIQLLINESVEIRSGNSKVTLTGVDDVHYFYSKEAIQALDASPKNPFKILLVHSPEMVEEAEENGYSLYLCGHTHAGQISLPNGTPIVTHVNKGKRFVAGRWRYKQLEGYTSSGTGVSGLTVRYFTQSEIASIKLIKTS